MNTMRIGELAERVGVTTKTIRYYESIGLVAPPDRTASGYRSYGRDALDRLVFIRDAQATGLTLAEIHSVLELKDQGERSCEHTRALLHRHIDEIDAQLTRLADTRKELVRLARRADSSDPTHCNDPHRCQVIESRSTPGTSPRH
jgi:DNA-binding transcriptional MerR regulator